MSDSNGYARGGVIHGPGQVQLPPDECIIMQRFGAWTCVRAGHEHLSAYEIRTGVSSD